MRHRLWFGLLLGLALLTAGCNHARYRQMESVASDWCMTIRASQVIPVYPPREDLEPGDVFLVTQPLPNQAREYKTKGYLPLDQSYQRLDPYLIRLHYSMGYVPTFLAHPFARVPHPVPRRAEAEGTPTDKLATNATQGAKSSDSGTTPPDSLNKASETLPKGFANATLPLAFFPAYSFSVDAGGQLDLAVPISGLPMALSLIGGKKATGQVVIKDAFTYGLPLETMYETLRQWADNDKIQRGLKSIAVAHAPTQVYLRVVNRVYLTGAVDVSIQSGSSFGGAFSLLGGGQQDGDITPSLASGSPETTAEKNTGETNGDMPLATLTDRINAAVKTAEKTPHGSFSFRLVTAHAVSMREAFERPLVIGYIAFDVPVLLSGKLGAPSLSREALDTEYSEEGQAILPVPAVQRNYTACRARFMKLDDDSRAQFISRMTPHLPEEQFGGLTSKQYAQAKQENRIPEFLDSYTKKETSFFLNDPDSTNMAILDAACRFAEKTAATK